MIKLILTKRYLFTYLTLRLRKIVNIYKERTIERTVDVRPARDSGQIDKGIIPPTVCAGCERSFQRKEKRVFFLIDSIEETRVNLIVSKFSLHLYMLLKNNFEKEEDVIN